MGINASKVKFTGTRAEAIAPGTYPGRLVQVIDLGLQAQRPYEGKDKPPAYEIMTTWEMVDEFLKDEDGNDDTSKPRWLSETFSLYSIDQEKAKSTKRYLALDPNKVHGGDWGMLVGTAANVTIVQNPSKNGSVYNNITAISAMRPKDLEKVPKLVNAPRTFNLDEPDMVVFNSFPDWIKNKIKENLEFNGSVLEKMLKVTNGHLKVVKAEEDETPY